jgi:hypothetical protein
MKRIDETVVGEYVDLVKWMGYSLRRLPISIRDADEGLLHVSSLAAMIGDTTCDPRSGGIAGSGNLAEIYGVGVQQFRKNILSKLTYVRDLGGIPVTHVSSAQADAQNYRAKVRKQRCDNLKKWTDCSSGY